MWDVQAHPPSPTAHRLGAECRRCDSDFRKLTLDSVVFANNHALAAGGADLSGAVNQAASTRHSRWKSSPVPEQRQRQRVTAISNGRGASPRSPKFDVQAETAPVGGAIGRSDGNSTFSVTMTIDRSTFAGNTATFAGVPIAVEIAQSGTASRSRTNTFTGQ